MKATRKRKPKRKAKAGRPGPKPGHGGRPPKADGTRRDRSIRLKPTEWEAVRRLAPGASYSDSVRVLVKLAEKKQRRRKRLPAIVEIAGVGPGVDQTIRLGAAEWTHIAKLTEAPHATWPHRIRQLLACAGVIPVVK